MKKICKDDWWNGFTHECGRISTPEGKPRSKIIDETSFAIKREYYEYEKCYICGKIFTYVRKGYWQWKDGRGIQV